MIGFLLSFINSCILFLISYELSKYVVVVENYTVLYGRDDNDREEERKIRMTRSPIEKWIIKLSVEEGMMKTNKDSTIQGRRTLVMLLHALAVILVGVTCMSSFHYICFTVITEVVMEMATIIITVGMKIYYFLQMTFKIGAKNRN